MNHARSSLLQALIAVLVTARLPAEGIAGSVTADATWHAASSPCVLTGTVTVEPGVTLTIEPGTTVQLGKGVDLIVKNGGRLLAEGSSASPIRFTRPPNTRQRWGGIVVEGGRDSPETRITH